MVHCIKLWASVDNELKFEFLMWLEETAKMLSKDNNFA